ncbi:MAG: nucleotidyl transferase AbiEii/AbiGii toxin family protein [Burkholderiaceae bacterium]|jgi:predicted nucleotidyltransferase|nr:nucleotidyl transferase AbiEii/AbiGii toxin family protein [Burkholderiaceae bacterium]
MYKILPHRPLDPLLHQVLKQVCISTSALSLDCFVGGAMARDILLTHVFDQKVQRATRDVDIGLYIDHWDQFTRLKEHLIESGRFVADMNGTQRLRFRSGDTASIPLDLIPFGGIAGVDHSISWPPEHDTVLNVIGFEDALHSAIEVNLGHDLQTKICSLPSLAVLKLIAWKDRGLTQNKDAIDFLLIVRQYGPALNLDRLYESEQQLLINAGGDPELAGAALLGKDASRLCKQETSQLVAGLLSDDRLCQRLKDHLVRALSATMEDHDFRIVDRLVAAFTHGFTTGG